MSLLALTILEIVLGVNNIVFISIAASKVAKEHQGKATRIEFVFAMVLRIFLLLFISVLIMMAFSTPVGRFVNDHTTIQIFGLSFWILIGFMLILKGVHLANLQLLDPHIGAIPKGYLYFSIAFSMGVESLNMKFRKKTK